MFVKVCGVRTEADVDAAVEAGADAVGIVFAAGSVRQVGPEKARQLAERVPPGVLAVGVFRAMPAAQARQLAVDSGVTAIQLHGPYPAAAFAELADLPVTLIRATSLVPGTDVRAGACGEHLLLLDSPVAGSGTRWDLSRLAGARPAGRWLLAGGLSPANVGEAIAAARPWGVDVSSGVESSPGVKSHHLIREFVSAARQARQEQPGLTAL